MADFDPVSYIMGAKAGSGGGGGGGSTTLSGLTDVDISNPSDGQTLVYNASAGKWENGAGGGGTPDMKILTTDYSGMWGQATYTVLSGTYAALKSKCQSREASMVELFVEIEEDPSQGTFGQKAYFSAVEVALFSAGGTEFIQLGFSEPDGGTFGLYAYPDNTVTGVWPFGD